MKVNYFIWFVIYSVLMLSSNQIYAQISEGGLPPSFNYPQKADLTAKLKSSQVIPVRADINKLRMEDAERELENLPLRATVIIPVELDINTHGEWMMLPDGERIWTLNLKADGAIASMLYYDEFFIPEGGKLFIYNADRTHVLGAYTTRSNPIGRKFATELVAGDEFILEYVAPVNFGVTEDKSVLSNLEKARIKISGLGYGYNYLQVYSHSGNQLRAIGDAGTCHVNINCPEGADWQLHKRGVAHTLTPIGGMGYICSGTIINNTRNDGDPLYLSAHHCFTVDEVKGNTEQRVFYFHYEQPDCENLPQVPTTIKTLVGAEMLVDLDIQGGSDGSLLRLLDEIPADYLIYYNGWDRRNMAPDHGVGIHHPAGDTKKISTFTTPAISDTWAGSGSVGAPDAHWRLSFSATESGHGIVEGGSSGSPLFNPDGRVTGTLTGGNTYCYNLSGTAAYGKLWYHWDQMAGEGNQMSVYLDPLNTGQKVLDGYFPSDYPIADFTYSRQQIYAGESIKFIDQSWQETYFHWYFEDGTPESFEGKEPPLITFNTPGEKNIRLVINQGTTTESTKEVTIHVIEKPGTAVPTAKFTFDRDILLREDFEENEEGWSFENYGELEHRGWTVIGFGNVVIKYNFSMIDPTSQFQAMIIPDSSDEPRLDSWAKSPELTIPENTFIEFYAGYGKTDLYEPYDIVYSFYVSEDDGQSWQKQWSTEETDPNEIWDWRKINLSLAEYEGKTLRFAWRYEGRGGDYVCLDGIKVISYGDTNTGVTLRVNQDYVELYDISEGEPLSWEWTFEGGEPAGSTSKEPGKVYYSQLGTYAISLTVKNSLGEDTYTFPNAVTVIDERPQAAFNIEGGYTNLDYMRSIPVGASLNFTDVSTNYPIIWNWYFEGGTPPWSKEQHPSDIVYDTEGEYSVSLEVVYTAGANAVDSLNTIKVTYTDRIWNMLPGEDGLSVLLASDNSFLTGTKSLASIFAERFDAPLDRILIESIDIMFHKVSLQSGSMAVNIYNEVDGYPGSIIHSFEIDPEEIQEDGYTTYMLAEPLLIEEAFYIGVENFAMMYGMWHQIAIKSSEDRGVENKNTAYTFNQIYSPVGGNLNGWFKMSEVYWYNSPAISLNIVPQITYVTEDIEPAVSLFDVISPYTGKPVPVQPVITGNLKELPYTIEYEGVLGTQYAKTTAAPVNSGTYEVTVKVEGDMIHTDAEAKATLMIRNGSGSEMESIVFNIITLSPNPATDRVYVQISEESKIEITSLNGQKLKEVILPSSGFVDICHLSTGVYVVRIVSDNDVTTLKLIKK